MNRITFEDGTVLVGPRNMRVLNPTEEDLRARRILRFNEYVENEIGDDLRISIIKSQRDYYYVVKSMGRRVQSEVLEEYNFRFKIDSYSPSRLYDYIIENLEE